MKQDGKMILGNKRNRKSFRTWTSSEQKERTDQISHMAYKLLLSVFPYHLWLLYIQEWCCSRHFTRTDSSAPPPNPWWEDHWFLYFYSWPSIYLFLKCIITDWFLTPLGFRGCKGFFLVVASGGRAPVAVHEPLIAEVSLAAELRLQGAWASVLVARGLSSCSLWAPGHKLSSCSARSFAPRRVGSSWIRGQTRVSCTGRQILYHWTTREPHTSTCIIQHCSLWISRR